MEKLERLMSDHIYKIVEIVGSSPHSIEDAIQSAINRASQTLRHLRWFEVVQTRGEINDGKVAFFQVYLKVGFTME
jgi:flavin-binding protein dodecin